MKIKYTVIIIIIIIIKRPAAVQTLIPEKCFELDKLFPSLGYNTYIFYSKQRKNKITIHGAKILCVKKRLCLQLTIYSLPFQ